MLGATDAALAAEGNRRVLVIYSTRRDSVLAGVGDRELSRSLDTGLSQHLDYYTEYLDIATFSGQEFQEGFVSSFG